MFFPLSCRPVMGAAALIATLPALAAGPNETPIALCVPLTHPGATCTCSVEAIEDVVPEAAFYEYLHFLRRSRLLGSAEFADLAEAATRACQIGTGRPQSLRPVVAPVERGHVAP